MIEPDQFYHGSDEPSTAARRRIWRSVEAQLSPQHRSWLVLERRSFLFGIAAAFLIMLAGFGAMNVVQGIADQSRPPAIRVDDAYRSAIKEFEALTVRIEPASSTVSSAAASPDSRRDVLLSRKEILQSLDRGIEALRADLRSGDISPVKRARLRDLYSKKLVVLLDMIEQGEITL